MLAMKWGDNCWLKWLLGQTHLNGRQVVLDRWVDDRQRWSCKPVGWALTLERDSLAVKPRNLANEPPPPAPAAKPAESTDPATSASARLIVLMDRESALRASATHSSNLSGQLRLALCQRELLSFQSTLFQHHQKLAYVDAAQEKILSIELKIDELRAMLRAQNKCADLDFWEDEDDEDDVWNDPGVREWVARKRR